MPTPDLLLGVEVDASLASIDGDLAVPGILTDKTGTGEYEWLSSAKVRAGWATDDLLLFATGGVAFAGFDYEDETGCEFTQTRKGFLIGGGGEMKISDRASVKGEYNYIDFGNEDQDCTWFIFPTQIETDADMHVVKFGLNYAIGGP